MRQLIFAAVCAAAAFAQQPPDLAALGLTGGRFAPPSWEQMTPEQRQMIESVVAGPRAGNLGGPFNVMLRSPEMGNKLQDFGASMRFLTSMPVKLRELAIILTARHWTSQFEWRVHAAAARQGGLSNAIVDAIRDGKRPEAMADDEATVYTFATELLNTKQVSDATFARAKSLLGERGVVDLVALMGYYQTVAMLLNVDRYPLPAGAQPELKPLP